MKRYFYDIYKDGDRVRSELTTKEVKEFFGDKSINPNDYAAKGCKYNGYNIRFNREIKDADFLKRLSGMRNVFTATTLKQWDCLHENYGKAEVIALDLCAGVKIIIEITETMKRELCECSGTEGLRDCENCSWNDKRFQLYAGSRTDLCTWDKVVHAVTKGGRI